ncbi:DHA2 family efflux MFS transporter permease subunit [Tessaracoccus sp.]
MAQQASERTKSSRWLGLFFISLGVAIIIVDSTIVNVAIPSIIDDIGLTSSGAQWVQEIYTLVFAALLLMWGRMADEWGRRRLFIVGVVIFALSSVLAATAGSGELLIAARAVQGIGGSMMLPTSLSILNATFRGKDRGIAFAFWGATIGGMAALGPLLGGWLTTSFSWRWAFGINIPLGILVIVGLLMFVAESKDEKAVKGADLPGAVLAAVGFGGLVFALIEGRNYGWLRASGEFSMFGWTWPFALSASAAAGTLGVVSLVTFVLVERRRSNSGRVAMLDLSLFAIPSFRNGNIAAAIVSMGEFGIIFSLPLWLQNVTGYSAFQTGLALLPLAVGSFAASGVSATVGQRFTPVALVRAGIALEIIGVLGLGLLLQTESGWLTTSPLLFVYGVGVGLATAQLTGVVLVDVPIAQSGQGSGTQSTARQVGSALGIAVLGTILFTTLGARLETALEALAQLPEAARLQLVESVKQTAGAIIPSLGADPSTAAVAEAARIAFTGAVRASVLSAAAFLVVGLLASLSLGGAQKPRHAGAEVEEDDVQPGVRPARSISG